jgi:MoaF N-terminal domain
MSDLEPASEIRGKTMRWSWTTGPTKGATHEHVFGADGTVEWRAVETDPRAPEKPARGKRRPPARRRAEPKTRYAAMRLAPGLYLVSYLGRSGYTLTVALDFGTRELQGIASGAKESHPVRGTFEVVK